ncbi:MAG: hypothetical protein HQL41_07020 [Alphaproteobacteria bacterium]|nr:hypothetical protein [Alphaproteobacteria bacterium]
MTAPWTIAFEARGIQSWIVGAGRLLDLAGGSDVIEDLCGSTLDEILRALEIPKAAVLVRGAGRFRLEVEQGPAADRFFRLWPLVVAEAAPDLRFSFDRLADGGEAAVARRFAAAAPPAPTLPAPTPFCLVAQRTGGPAIKIGRKELDEDEKEAEDAGTVRRRLRNGDILAERFGLDQASVTDVEKLARNGGNGYVGLVHADGNGIGRMFAASADVRRLSRRLGEATQAAAREAMRETGQVSARPIVLGGDDMTVLLPAGAAVPFAARFLRHFRAGMNDECTASAGIAIVPFHYPFGDALHLAESLCRWVKERTDGTGSALAFFRATTTIALDYPSVLKQELDKVHEGERRRLTLGPYAVDETTDLPAIDKIEALRDALAELPRGAWRELAAACHESGDGAHRRVKRLLEVAEDRDDTRRAAERLRGALDALGCWRERPGFRLIDGIWVTPILDVEALSSAGRAQGGGT